jgi:hypothetical protein
MNVQLHCVLVAALLAPAVPRDTESLSTAARRASIDVAPEAALGAVQVCAYSGRVEFVGADGRVRLIARGERLVTGGPSYLEAGAGASVEIAWPTLGSVRLEGPCVVEWDAPVMNGTVPELALRITTLCNAEFELRAAVLALELPGGWRVNTRNSAFRCSSTQGGRVQVAARAGAALVIDGPRHGPLWPRHAVVPGAELMLGSGAPLLVRKDRTRTAPPWESVEWPWRAPHRAASALSPDSPAVRR